MLYQLKMPMQKKLLSTADCRIWHTASILGPKTEFCDRCSHSGHSWGTWSIALYQKVMHTARPDKALYDQVQ